MLTLVYTLNFFLRALCKLFKVFEHDKDGYISTTELSHVSLFSPNIEF